MTAVVLWRTASRGVVRPLISRSDNLVDLTVVVFVVEIMNVEFFDALVFAW